MNQLLHSLNKRVFLCLISTIILINNSLYGQTGTWTSPTGSWSGSLSLGPNANENTRVVSFSVSGLPADAFLSQVCFAFTHTYNADMDVTLNGPLGSRNLCHDKGGTGDNMSICMADNAASGVTTSNSSNINGTYRPDQALRDLCGNPNGTWTITFADDGNNDGGTLTSCSITFTTISGDQISFGPSGTWYGYFYNGIDLNCYRGPSNYTGSPAFTNTSVPATIDTRYINPDYFSSRYRQTFSRPTTGWYRVTSNSDDGVRINNNGTTTTWNIINDWTCSAGLRAGNVLLTGGQNYDWTMEMRDCAGGQTADFNMCYIGPDFTYGNNVWNSYAFADQSLSNYYGVITSGISANTSTNLTASWGSGAPTTGNSCSLTMPSNTFSTRHMMNRNFPCGKYRFTYSSDDGIRISVDGGSNWIVNYWDNTTHTGTIDVDLNGSTNIIVDQRENTGDANVSVAISALWTADLVVDAGANVSVCVGGSATLNGSASANPAPGMSYTQNFAGCSGSTCNNWTVSGVGNFNTIGCTYPASVANLYNASNASNTITSGVLATSNGGTMTLGFDYGCFNWDALYNYGVFAAMPAGSCTFTAYWSPDGTTWNTLGSVNNLNNANCNTYVFPTFTPPNGTGVRIRITARWVSGDFYSVIDNITLSQTGITAITYAWSGTNVTSGGGTLTPVVTPASNPTVYTLTATSNGCTATDIVTVNVNAPAGDPTLFGPNTWYVYAYNANTNYYDPPVTGVQYTNLDNTIISYAGWYTHNTLNIDSGTAWGSGGSPDDAPGYAGCPVTDDNHVFVYKRRGFPCGTYNISNISHDDAVNILVDGVSVHQTTACCGSNPNINIELGGNSTVEIRLGENQGSSYLAVNFVPVVNALAVNNDTKTCYVGANSGWNTFTIGNGRLLASIEPGASTLGNVEVTSYVSPSPFLVSACAPLYNPAHETAVLSRRWTITPATQPTNPVRVRLYFGEDEHSLLAPLSASSSSPDDLTAAYSDLRLSKYHHPSNTAVNSSFSDNCANIPAGQMTLWNPADANLISTLFTGFDANGRYTEYLINPPAFSEFWLHGSTTVSPLAITLASFSAKCNGSKVDIHWTTDAEFNSDYFTLERSRDGIIWDVVTTATATGSHNTATTYQATDIAASEVYYRLKETDLDGKSEYHGPIVVNCDNSSNELIVYPNPNKGTFTVAVNTSEAMGDAAILVQDVTGKTVASQTVHVFSGTNTVYFENANLIRGTYIVSILGKEKSTFTPVKLVIQ